MPLLNISESDWSRVQRAVKTVERGVLHSPVTYSGGGGGLIGGGSGVAYTGYFSVHQVITQLPVPATQPFWKMDIVTGVVTEDAGPMPSTSPGVRWGRTATTAGDQIFL